LDSCSFNELPARLNKYRDAAHAAVSIENGRKGKSTFLFLNFFFNFKLLSASERLATLANPARFSTAHQLRGLSPPNGLMKKEVSDSTKICRRLSDATMRNTRRRKCFLRLAGLRCPTILCEFLIIFEDFTFFRKIALHSLVGLDNGAMLLLGGEVWETNTFGTGSLRLHQPGIWQLKETQWSRIGELLKV
jgi:hypothetical protein